MLNKLFAGADQFPQTNFLLPSLSLKLRRRISFCCRQNARFACLLLLLLLLQNHAVAQRRNHPADSTIAKDNIEKGKTSFSKPRVADSVGLLAYKHAKLAKREDLQGHAAFIICFANLVDNYNMDRAIKWGDTAIAHFNRAKNFLWAGYVGRNLGIQLDFNYKFETGIDYLNKSSKAFERAGDTIMVAHNYSTIAVAFKDFGDFISAKKYANMALRIAETSKKPNNELRWRCNNTLAIIYDDNNEQDKAIALHLKNIPLAVDDEDLSSTFNNLGNSYLKQKNYKPANEYLLKALAKNRKDKTLYQFASTYTNLARVNSELDHEAEAKKYLDSALTFSRRSQSNQKLIEVLIVAHAVAYKYGDFRKAADYLSERSRLSDSLLHIDKAKVILDMQTKYETEKKQQQIALLNREFRIQGLELDQNVLALSNKNLQLDRNNLQLKQNETLIRQKQLETHSKTQQIKLLDTENEVQRLELLRRNIGLGIIAGLLLVGGMSAFLFYNRYKLKQETRLQAEVIRQQDMATKAVLIAEENERKRISGELHDGLGQMFSAVKMNLSGISDNLEFKDTDSQKVFDKTLDLIDESCKEVRVISHQMAPNVLLKSGLTTAIRDFANKIDARKLNVKLETIGINDRLDQNVETVLYRVIQETVNNVIKHAAANTLDIQLIRDEEGINVMIEDNGKGFDVKQADKFEGIGLRNIRSRIGYLKGTVDFSSEPGKGTLVAIHIPYGM